MASAACGLAPLAYWGARIGPGMLMKVALGVGAPSRCRGIDVRRGDDKHRVEENTLGKLGKCSPAAEPSLATEPIRQRGEQAYESPAQCSVWAREDLNLRPLLYQQTAGNRCAAAHFRRSRTTVGVEVKCSLCLQLSVLFARRDPAPTEGIIPLSASRNSLNTALYLHICPQPMLLQHPPALPHLPNPAHSPSVVPLPSPRTIQIQHERSAPRRGFLPRHCNPSEV